MPQAEIKVSVELHLNLKIWPEKKICFQVPLGHWQNSCPYGCRTVVPTVLLVVELGAEGIILSF